MKDCETSNWMLSQELLTKLDKKLDEGIPIELLSQIPRNLALMQLLRFYEDQIRFYNPQLLQGQVAGQRELAKQGQDSIHFAMRWIHKYCAVDAPFSALRKSDESSYMSMKTIMDIALTYSSSWDYMGLLWRGRHKATLVDENCVEISYFDKATEEMEIADQLLNAPDPPNFLEAQSPPINMTAFLAEAHPRRLSKGKVEYSFPIQHFEKLRNHFYRVTEPLWEMPHWWDIGGYTFGDFRQFWITLLAWCTVHEAACYYSGVEGVGVDSLIDIKTDSQWKDELSFRSDLPSAKVKQMISDLTYAPALYDRPRKPNPNVLQQPFFRVAPNQLALGNQIALGSNADRNMWSLLGILRQPVQDRLKEEKEASWLDELRKKLGTRNFQVFGPYEFVVDNERSDLDAFIYDSANNCGLVTQLKWHVAPDRINEIAHTAEELNDGIRQAVLAMKWIEKQPTELAAKMKIDITKIKACQFRPIVLSKNIMGKGLATNDAVPICSERLFDWILLDPHQKSLETLWQVLKQRRYMPKLGKHYEEDDATFELNGVRLIGKNMGLRLIGRWDPKLDIDFTGL